MTLIIDSEAMDILRSVIAVRFVAGASGPVEDVLLSVLSSVDEGKYSFLVAGCDGKLVVEPID